MSARSNPSPWSFRIASVQGIPIRIHFTFLLFVGWIAMMARIEGSMGILFLILAIFGCVILHELGHALTAKKFGIGIRDITIYPIGGVAMMTDRATPKQEFWITVAGPAVNLAISVVIGLYLVGNKIPIPGLAANFDSISLLQALFVANVFLALFNLVPAFPMDGGRILRSLLAMRMPSPKATRIAGVLGQGMAILFGFLGLFTGNILLMVIAFFVFVGAGNEMGAATTIALTEGRKVSDAMMTRFAVLQHGDSLARAADLLLSGSQTDFPVMVGDEVAGVLRRDDIVRGLSAEGRSGYVAGYMDREPLRAQMHEPLTDALERISRDRGTVLFVMDGPRLAGLLNADNLVEFMMLLQAEGAPPASVPKFEV